MENSDEMNTNQQQLKHLGYVRAVAINTVLWLSTLYHYAKTNSGPFTSAVASVEAAVTALISPVFNKFKIVPHHLLVFLDHQVDVAMVKFDERAPALMKKVASEVHGVVESTAQVSKELLHQAQTGGPLSAARYAVNETKHTVLHQSVKVWSKLDKLAPFHAVAEMTVPTAAHFSNKYNKLISDLRAKGYAVFSYVPLVPIDEIAKAFKQTKPEIEGEREVVLSQ
ncbi:hypothetical protein RND81_07G205900 [Saponaria officinalis]|uniref:REF/SRPP-like protein n=1 Tax=Saponaria officinalis TaxID=3572 RepID=A0AAW1JQQ7_SAPOF